MKVKVKVFFIIFKGLSVAKNYLRPESAPLTDIKKGLHVRRSRVLRYTSELYQVSIIPESYRSIPTIMSDRPSVSNRLLTIQYDYCIG